MSQATTYIEAEVGIRTVIEEIDEQIKDKMAELVYRTYRTGYDEGSQATADIANTVIRQNRREAYRAGFEHAERLFKPFRQTAVVAVAPCDIDDLEV